MQNDLISRKRVIENIWDVFNSYANNNQRFDEYETEAINNAFIVLQKQIENQPTAYSVEKVMAELEENGQKMSEAKAIRPYAKHSPSDHRYYKAISVKKAVDIVRNGGKE